MEITSLTARREAIAEHVEAELTRTDAFPLRSGRRNRLVFALAALDQKIAAGKQGMALDYRKVTDE